MSDHETIIRAAAQKLAKKYSLPAHIVEEDFWHELKGQFGEGKPELPDELNIHAVFRHGASMHLEAFEIEDSHGGKNYDECLSSKVKTDSIGISTYTSIQLFLKARK